MQEWHTFYLHTRASDQFSPLHHARDLAQEWWVDAYANVEQRRLEWLRVNQQTLRSETYQEVCSAIQDGIPLGQVGRRTILPASFVGSPRYMTKSYYDSMALVRRFGKPTLFITMTCNPKWQEIRENLFTGQQAKDRPDLVTRVFKLKLDALMVDLKENAVFGKVLSWCYVIEYQKRGLPHAHILLILDPTARPMSSDDVDLFVCAELPDRHTQPELFNTVCSSMLHGPCGRENPSSPCMVNGRCKARYPRPFQDVTEVDNDHYPRYRRRNDGRTAQHGNSNFIFDNRWVVPYNPFLSAKYDCHINVEVACHIAAVKYLYKYVNKGVDRAAFITHRNDEYVNEIQDYLDGRFLCANECCFRLLAFDTNAKSPPVESLPVHLEGKRTVWYHSSTTPSRVLNDTRMSKLEAFFEYCRCACMNGDPVDLLYPDAPTQLTWDAKKTRWRKRQRGQTIGRVYWVPPTSGEVSA